MTINNLLKAIEIQDHTTSARFSDGSGGCDSYTLVVFVDGHGTLLSTQVKELNINHGSLYIKAVGTKKGGQQKCPAPALTGNGAAYPIHA